MLKKALTIYPLEFGAIYCYLAWRLDRQSMYGDHFVNNYVSYYLRAH